MSTSSDILKYIMNTPENTNPAIVKEMLSSMEGGGSGGNVLVAHATVEWNDKTSQYDVTSFDKTFSELWELFGVSPCFVELQFPGDWDTVLLSLIARSPETTGEVTSPASVSFSNLWNLAINTLSVFSDGSFSVHQDFIQTT